MSDTVRLDPGAVSTVTIDRPDRMNALNAEVLDDLDAALDDAESAGARVLVIRGAGEEAFVAGADIGAMAEMSSEEAHALASRGHRTMDRVASFPAPTIAAIDGYALGGGLELALACDLRVASERAVLGQPEVDLGIMPGWGGTQRLPAIVGEETARRMIYFGERIDAQDAYERGLVGDLVAHDELEAFVADLASDLAERPRRALEAASACIDRAGDGEAGFAYERRTWAGLFGTADQREGMAAFLDDRDPDFE